ncbi:tetratricopeptide repeat protein [Streptomyces sp. SID13666]|nr:tetratricopeptide repeat protein [Streptomyces sp. SID13666]NEA69618.1 tetratricopeptide repeat protein [Streptomyces sp. SID13588]
MAARPGPHHHRPVPCWRSGRRPTGSGATTWNWRARPAPLRTTGTGTWDHRFRAYGYPAEHRRQGVPVRGEIIGHAGDEWLQVEAGPHAGWGLEQGFSGSPVWDVNIEGVVGMLVARDKVVAVDRRTAYAVRVETVARYWPGLAPFIRDTTTTELRDRLESLLWLPLTGDGAIPRVDEVDPHDIGVSRSKYSDLREGAPYVSRRPQDDQLDAYLAEERFVVLAGRSKAGKSRTLYEALLRTMPGARLIVPRPDGPDRRVLDDLSRLLPLPTGSDPVVVWLDDLHRFLRPGGLDLQILERFTAQPGITVVATIPAKHRAALTGMENDVGRTTRTVLAKARTVELPSLLSTEDTERARELYPREDFDVRGIGELMVAAPGLEQRFNDGADSDPAGWALARAATDWLRMGLAEGVPEEALRELFDAYLYAYHPELDADDAGYRTALAWARQPVAGSIALVQQVPGPDGAPGYAATPYMAEYLDTRDDDPSAAVPRFAWQYLTDSRPPGELLATAYTALIRDETEIAEQTLLRIVATASDDRDNPAWAALMLGEMYLYLARFGPAVEQLDSAVASDVESVVPLAQVVLAGALMVTGDRTRARELLEAAVGSRDPQVSQMAQVGLAGVLVKQGESDRAERLLEAVLAAGDTEVTPLAQAQLVKALTLSDGEPAGVRAGRRPGAVHGKSGAGAAPAIVRGGPAEPAEQPWTLSRAVGESIAGQITAMARANLGGLLVNQGKLDRAEELLRSVLDSGQFHAVPLAQACLGELLIVRGRYEEAETLLRALVRSGHPLLTPLAKVFLAITLLHQERIDEAMELLLEVAGSDNPDQAPRAACALGECYSAQGDGPAAVEWLERAIATGHPDWSVAGLVDLADVVIGLARRGAEDGAPEGDSAGDEPGGTERAVTLLTTAIAAGHPDLSPGAADMLGDFLSQEGRYEEAEAAYRTAIGSGHQHWSPIARIDLGLMLRAPGNEPDRVVEELTGAIAAGHPDLSPGAADLLGDFLSQEGRYEEAEAAYRTAIDSGHEQWSQIARMDLALMLADQGDLGRAESLLRVVADSDDPTVATWAVTVLGMVLIQNDQRPEGLGHLRAASDANAAPASQMARFQLAKCLVEDGDAETAEELLRSVVDDEPTDVTEVARAYLAVQLLRGGDEEAAEELLAGVENSGDQEAIALAYLGTGEYLLDTGEVQAAGELLAAAMEIADEETAPRAAVLLGVVRRSINDLEEARQLLSDALASGEPSVEPMARRYLGSTLFRLLQYAEAERTLLPLATSDDTEHRPQALLLLGQVLTAAGRPADAYPWFEQAIECGDPDTEAVARYDYAELLLSAGHRDRAEEVYTPQVAEDQEAPADPADLAAPAEAPRLAPAAPGEPVAQAPHPLPAAVLALLGDVADAEGAPEEARFWYRLAGRPLPER